MTLRLASHRPCVAFTDRLFGQLHFAFVRHRYTDLESHKREAFIYKREQLASVRRLNKGMSPIRIDPATGSITFKCGNSACLTFVKGEHLTRTKVFIAVEDNEKPPTSDGPATKTIQVERELCPHCFVLSSKDGRQTYDPTPASFGRSTAPNRPGMIWRNLRTDARPSSEVDPETFNQMRRRYGR